MQFKNIPISDSHTHFFWDLPPVKERAEHFKEIMELFGYDTVTVHSIPYDKGAKPKARDFTLNLAIFYLKSLMPDRVYAFTGLTLHHDKTKNTPEFYLEQLKFHMAAGFDGLKMYDCAPVQRIIGGAYNDEKYQLVYKYCEENQIPICMHTNGDESFWKKSWKDKWHGQFSWRDYHNELLDVLKKYPKLRLQVAHFGFMSEHIEEARELLDTYENVYLDICPNPFMFAHFANNQEIWRPFFEKYQDRIIYGTDIGAHQLDVNFRHSLGNMRTVRGFLEADKPFEEVGYLIPPMKIEDEGILRKIYKENMMRFYQNKAPKKLNPEIMKKEYDILMEDYYTLLNVDDLENLEVIKTVL